MWIVRILRVTPIEKQEWDTIGMIITYSNEATIVATGVWRVCCRTEKCDGQPGPVKKDHTPTSADHEPGIKSQMALIAPAQFSRLRGFASSTGCYYRLELCRIRSSASGLTVRDVSGSLRS